MHAQQDRGDIGDLHDEAGISSYSYIAGISMRHVADGCSRHLIVIRAVSASKVTLCA
jgi:hypothetical protein